MARAKGDTRHCLQHHCINTAKIHDAFAKATAGTLIPHPSWLHTLEISILTVRLNSRESTDTSVIETEISNLLETEMEGLNRLSPKSHTSGHSGLIIPPPISILAGILIVGRNARLMASKQRLETDAAFY